MSFLALASSSRRDHDRKSLSLTKTDYLSTPLVLLAANGSCSIMRQYTAELGQSPGGGHTSR